MTEKHDETTARKEARRRKRRATIRRRLSVGIALAISLVIAFVVLTKSRYLPSQVSSYVNDHYLADSPFEFSCERISGDFVHRVVISNPVLRYHSSSASFNVFRADEVVVDYKVLELTRLNLAIENLLLSNVRLQLRQNESGQLVLPTPKSQARRPSAVSGSVNVERFHVDGLHLFFGGEDRELAVRDVNLVGSVAYRAGVSRLIVEEGTAYVIGSNTPISTLRLDVEHEGSRVTLRDFNARTGESVVVANGGYEAGKLERVQLVFNPISLDEMHELGIIPDLSGEFGGSVICSGAPDSLRIQGTLTGAGFGITLGGMQFDGRVAGDWLEFERVEGRVFGSRIAGAFRYQIAEPHDYSFHGDCRDLDLTQGFVPNAGLPESNFGGGLRLEYNATAGRYHIDAALDSMMFAGYRSRQTEFVGTWADPEGLIIERLVLDRPGYSGEILGSVGSDGAFDLVASANGDDFGYLWDFFSLPQFHGSVNATARATGFVDNLQINLNGDATGMEFLSAHIDTGTVNAEIKGIGTPNVEVKLGISGRHLKTGPLAFEAPRLYLEVDSTGVSIRDLTFARGDTTFTTSFDVDADSTQATIMLHRAGVRTPSDTWQLRHPSRIMWADGELAIDSLELASTRGRLGATGSYSHELGQCELDGWGENVELALLSEVLGTPVGVSGSADFHARVQGDIDRPAIRLDASVSRGHVDSVAFDNLVVRGGFGDTGYALDELRVIAGADTFSLDARWEYPLSPIEIARDGLDARLARSSALNAQARSKHFPLPSFLRAARQRPLLNGVFTGTVEVTGSVADPAVKLRGDIVPRDGDGIGLPPTRVALAYAGGMMHVEDVATRGDFDARITGTVPMQISFVDGFHLDRAADQRIEVHVAQSELKRLEPYLSQFMILRGRVYGDVVITGNMAQPALSGELRVDDGEVQLAEMFERYFDIDASVRFVDNVVHLSSLSARSGEKGTVNASGYVELEGYRPAGYQLDVSLRDFLLTSIPDFESQQSGALSVRSQERADGVRIPHITGKLEVNQATIYFDPAAGGGGSSSITTPTETPGWTCNIDLVGHNNVWIRSADLNVELGGDLILVRDTGGMYLRGDLNVLRGSYLIYANKFRIIDGSLNFSTATLRPGISINAYTPHREEGGVEKRIYLLVSWPQDKEEPNIQLSYDDPGYSQEDLYRMVGGTSIGTGVATTALEHIINQQMTGVDISIDQRARERTDQLGTQEQEMIIGVGKYLWQDVYMRYRQGLTLSAEQELQVEYRLSNLFLLRSEFIRNSRRGYQGRSGNLSDEFNLDVKFRWEY